MFISKYRLSLSLLLVIMLFALPSMPATAEDGARVYNLSATVSATGTTLFPPGPCREAIGLDGSFELMAHIVTFPHNPGRPAMLVELHLNGDGITGSSPTNHATYRGSQGNTDTFQFDTTPATFMFDGRSELRLVNPNLFPPGPCRAPKTINPCFFVGISQTESGPRLVVRWDMNPAP